MSEILSSFLVLDFCNEQKTRDCLESIKQHAKFPHYTIYLDNGSKQDYYHKFNEEGLCDSAISIIDGKGGGMGQTILFENCLTEYSYFIQNDQKLIRDITEKENNKFIELLNNGYYCIDLNGDQSRRGTWTDRAHFIKTAFYKSHIPNLENGGPGPMHNHRWNENYFQEVFEKGNLPIAHVSPLFFADCGSISIRTNPDGSKWEIRPDTKEVQLVQGPVKEKFVFPEFTDAEWQFVLDNQGWPLWRIPEKLVKHSFHVWN